MAVDEARALRQALDVANRELAEMRRQLALEQTQRRVFELEAENAALLRQQAAGLRLEVAPKGGVSVRGLQKFPVTLYKQQWLKLLAFSDEIRTFIARNDGKLSQGPPPNGEAKGRRK